MVIQKNSLNSGNTVAKALLANQVVIIPTDTIYGFSGIVPFTKDRIMDIKNRPNNKHMIRLISSPSSIDYFTNQKIPEKLLKFWPGALTLIVKSKDETRTIAIRCPGDEWLRNIIQKVASPIYSTSVNLAGDPPMHNFAEIKATFEHKVDILVDAGELSGNPSTIVDLTGNELVILRNGSVKI